MLVTKYYKGQSTEVKHLNLSFVPESPIYITEQWHWLGWGSKIKYNLEITCNRRYWDFCLGPWPIWNNIYYILYIWKFLSIWMSTFLPLTFIVWMVSLMPSSTWWTYAWIKFPLTLVTVIIMSMVMSIFH